MAAMRLLLLLLIGHLCLLLAAVVASPPMTTTNATSCLTSYRCGHDVEIRYPLWVDGGNGTGGAHCGYSSLRLECRAGTPVLPLPSGEYAVTRVLYRERTLSVFDLAATSNSTCPEVAGRNLTLPAGSPPPLSLTNRDSNLTFFINCNFTGFGSDHHVGCLQHGRLHTYIFRDVARVPYHDALLCGQVVGMPVVDPAADDVVAALRTGFNLSWSAPAAGGQCAACEMGGGQCGQLREVERWVFTCVKPASPASEPTSPASPATGPFLPNRAVVVFSLMGMMLLLGSVVEMG